YACSMPSNKAWQPHAGVWSRWNPRHASRAAGGDGMRPLPMLATASAPFDSEEYTFEVKWDGVRALASVEQGQCCVWGRHAVDYTPRYPELAVLGRLPAGTVVDGELVVWRDGRAEFPALLSRRQRLREAPALGQRLVVTYVRF